MQRKALPPAIATLILAISVAVAQDGPYLHATVDPSTRTFVVADSCTFRIAFDVLRPLPAGSEIRVLTPREGGWSQPSLDPTREQTPGQFGLVEYRLLRCADPTTRLTGAPQQYSDRGPPYTPQDRFSQFVMKLDGGGLAAGDGGEVAFVNARTSRTALHRDPTRNVTGYRLQVKPAGEDEWREIEGLPQYTMLPGPPNRLLFAGPSQVVRGEPFTLALSVTDQFANPVHTFTGVATLKSSDPQATLPGDFAFTAEGKGIAHVEGVVLSTPGRQTITVTSGVELPTPQTAFLAIEVLAQAPPLRLYWGELHNHGFFSYDARNWGGCTMRPADAYWYARQVRNLDFAAVTDHSMHNSRLTQQNMTEAEYIECQQAAKANDDPGRFVTFTAVEHRCARGDTNTFFLRDDAPFYMKDRLLTVQELWQFYRDTDIITIPHLHPLIKRQDRFDEIDPTKERLIEIHSNHGRYEFFNNEPLLPKKGMVEGDDVQSILARGHRLGFVAASDDHSGRPGIADLTGVYAAERTREAIFAALRARHTFGSTGPRINVEFRMGDAMMGDDLRLKPDDPLWRQRAFSARVIGTAKLRLVEIVRSGKVVYSTQADGQTLEFEYADTEPLDQCFLGTEVGNPKTAYYYLRITQQPPGTQSEQALAMAWTSPIFLSPEG
jgi:hypothetical protein